MRNEDVKNEETKIKNKKLIYFLLFSPGGRFFFEASRIALQLTARPASPRFELTLSYLSNFRFSFDLIGLCA